VVISTGVNDSIHENGQSRVGRTDSKYNMAAILDGVRQQGWQALVVSPPPNVDEEHNARIAGLDETFNAVCKDRAVPYLRLHQALKESTIWMQSIAAGDGYHPGEAGYDEFASLLAPFWLSWLGGP
jgi:lysophospholipase L1-like esterase